MALFSSFDNPQRSSDLRKVAATLSFTYEEEEDFSTLPLLEEFKLFQKGFKHQLRNCLTITDDMFEFEVKIFDYAYNIRAGKAVKTVEQTVFFVKSKQLALPHFWLKPETFFDKIAQFLHLQQDIDFSEHSAFSEQYVLGGADEEVVRHIFNESIRHYFTINKNWSLEGMGFFLVFYQAKKLLSPKDIAYFYETGKKIHDYMKAEAL